MPSIGMKGLLALIFFGCLLAVVFMSFRSLLRRERTQRKTLIVLTIGVLAALVGTSLPDSQVDQISENSVSPSENNSSDTAQDSEIYPEGILKTSDGSVEYTYNEKMGWVGTPREMVVACENNFLRQFGVPAELNTEGKWAIFKDSEGYYISGYFEVKDDVGSDFNCYSRKEGMYTIEPIDNDPNTIAFFKAATRGGGITESKQSDDESENLKEASPNETVQTDNTSPEADPTLKSLRSGVLPVVFNNVRNVGGDRGDDLGAGLWMSAESAGYICNETEAFGSSSINGLKSDLFTDLENSGYTYEIIEELGDPESGRITIWKAVGDATTAIGFFAQTATTGDAGTMAICRATPQ